MQENKKYIAALKLSVQLWIWLFNNPGMKKCDSPYWDEIEDFNAWCPLCEFYGFDCAKCILNKKKCCYRTYLEWKIFPFYFWRNNCRQKIHSALIAATLRREYERVTGDKQFRKSREARG